MRIIDKIIIALQNKERSDLLKEKWTYVVYLNFNSYWHKAGVKRLYSEHLSTPNSVEVKPSLFTVFLKNLAKFFDLCTRNSYDAKNWFLGILSY